MGGPVRVNGREVVTSKSGGVSFACGDVCIVPDGGGPTPFVNVAFSADAANTARTVRVNGVPVVLARSTFARSTGDEPGEDGGVVSGTNCGAAQFVNYSFDVRIESQSVPRAFDPMVHNLDAAGVPNAFSPAELQMVGPVDPEKDIICAAICFCAAGVRRDECVDCFQRLLADPVTLLIPGSWHPDKKPGQKTQVRYWDPHVPPGFYIEPAYEMKPPPPHPMLGDVKSATMKDAKGNPLPLPAGDRPWLERSRRPDVVVPIDPTKPPGPGNIKRVFDVKFPGDTRKNYQQRDYSKIGAPNCELEFVGPEDCDCMGRHKPKKKYLPKEIQVPRITDGPQEQPKSPDQPQPKNQEPDPKEEPEPLPDPELPPPPGPVPDPNEEPEPSPLPRPKPKEEPAPADLPLAAKVGIVLALAAAGASVAGLPGAAVGAAAGVVVVIGGGKKDDGPTA